MRTGCTPRGGPSRSSLRWRGSTPGRRPSAISGPSSAASVAARRGCDACCDAARAGCSSFRTPRPSYRSSPAGEEYAYLEDWHTRLRHRAAVPFGHSLALIDFGGVGLLLTLSPVSPLTTPADLALEAARRSRGALVSTRRAGHGEIFLPVRSGIGLAPAGAPLPPAMATRCATPRMLTYAYPPVIHQQQSLLQTFSCQPIQGTAYGMMTAAIVSGLLRAYRETHRFFEPPPCYHALTDKRSVDDLASGDRYAADY